MHAGKSVTVPQWVYDHHTALGTPVLPVAVLVPRRAIAEGLSKHVSEIRGCKLGEEVGLGMGGTAVWTTSSRIVFMTYGFFMGITISDQHFSRSICPAVTAHIGSLAVWLHNLCQL